MSLSHIDIHSEWTRWCVQVLHSNKGALVFPAALGPPTARALVLSSVSYLTEPTSCKPLADFHTTRTISADNSSRRGTGSADHQ